MIAVDRENRDSDVEIAVLVIDSREAVEVALEKASCREWDGLTYEKLAALPSSGLLKSSICTGLSPRVYSRRRLMTWYKQSRDGLFSWKRSPARRMKSTW